MGVKRPWHRRGIGRALIEAVVEPAISPGVQFLTVKTLSPSNDDPNYARTWLFYVPGSGAGLLDLSGPGPLRGGSGPLLTGGDWTTGPGSAATALASFTAINFNSRVF